MKMSTKQMQAQQIDYMPDDIMTRSSVKIERIPIHLLSTLKYQNEGLKQYRSQLINENLFIEGSIPSLKIQSLQVINHNQIQHHLQLKSINHHSITSYYLTNGQLIHIKLNQFTSYLLKIHLQIQYEIIYGLTLTNNIYKSIIKVQKKDYHLGSYGPGKTTLSIPIRTPGGFLGRGNYNCKVVMADKQGVIHGIIQYYLEVV